MRDLQQETLDGLDRLEAIHKSMRVATSSKEVDLLIDRSTEAYRVVERLLEEIKDRIRAGDEEAVSILSLTDKRAEEVALEGEKALKRATRIKHRFSLSGWLMGIILSLLD